MTHPQWAGISLPTPWDLPPLEAASDAGTKVNDEANDEAGTGTDHN